MHSALTTFLADEHRRELTRRRVPSPARKHRERSRAARVLVPGYRVTWTRMSLAAAGAGARRSWVIVISAPRAQ
jgi:hypothetical protein